MSSRFLIYGLIDPRDGQLRYVGKSCSGMKRPRAHMGGAVMAREAGTHVGHWIRRLRAENLEPGIEVLEEHEAAQTLLEAERHFIAYFRFVGCRLTNLTDGGEGPLGRVATSQHRKKVAEANSRRIWTDESRRKASESKLGRTHSQETRSRMSASRKGLPKSEEHRQKIAAALRGIPLSPQRRRAISESLKGRKYV